MPHPLYNKIAGLKAKLMEKADSSDAELLEVCEGLLSLIEQNRNDLTSAYEAQIRMDQQMQALEKRLPPYQGAR